MCLVLAHSDVSTRLCMHERADVRMGVLTQMLVSWHCPVAHLSNQHNCIAQGWPPWLWVLTVIAIFVSETDELIMGKELIVLVPHPVLPLMEFKGQ